jgi:hypothetical protein
VGFLSVGAPDALSDHCLLPVIMAPTNRETPKKPEKAREKMAVKLSAEFTKMSDQGNQEYPQGQFFH